MADKRRICSTGKELPRLRGFFLPPSDVYSSDILLSIDFLGAGSPAFRRPSNQVRNSLTMGTFLAARKMRAVDLLDSALNETRCTRSVQKRGYEKVSDLITPLFSWSRRGDLNPRPDDYELDRDGSLILAGVDKWLPVFEKIG